MLMGVVIASSLPDASARPGVGGVDALLVYLAAYGMMTIGAFAVILYLSTPRRPLGVDRGLGGGGSVAPDLGRGDDDLPVLVDRAAADRGFAGKLLLFVGAFGAPTGTPTMRNLYQVMAVIAAVNSAVGAYYYCGWWG
jgi:NADH-quinone oxidoreductase subunit N